jgi:hypothetical protein
MSKSSIAEYLSPKHKLIEIFQASRDSWKLKYAGVKKSLKSSQNRMRQLEASRTYWQERAKRAEDALGDHKHKADMINPVLKKKRVPNNRLAASRRRRC